MPFDGDFDATQVAPKQGGGAHPVGNKYPFKITSTKVTPTKDNSGGMFEVEFTSPSGSIIERYNLWNSNEQTRNIAKQELSALCHATGIFKLNFRDDGKALLNGQGLMDIGFQKGHEPSTEKPEGGYVELKKVYDVNGNEPGKTPMNQQSQQQSYGQGQPNNQVPNQTQNQQQGFGNQVPAGSGWGNQGAQNQVNQQQANGAPQSGGWSGQQQQTNQPQQNTNQPNNNQGGGWSQNNNGNVPQTAPWGNG